MFPGRVVISVDLPQWKNNKCQGLEGKLINPLVGVYIPNIRIPTKGGIFPSPSCCTKKKSLKIRGAAPTSRNMSDSFGPACGSTESTCHAWEFHENPPRFVPNLLVDKEMSIVIARDFFKTL